MKKMEVTKEKTNQDKKNKSIYMLGESRRRMEIEEIDRQRLQCLCKKFLRGEDKMYER